MRQVAHTNRLRSGCFRRQAVVWVTSISLSCLTVSGLAQEEFYVREGDYTNNTGRELSLPLCSSSQFNYPAIAGTTQRWYRFDVGENTEVCLHAFGAPAIFFPAAELTTYQSLVPSSGGILLDHQVLLASTYFIVFTVTPNTPVDIHIEFTCGVTCPPVNCTGCLPSLMPLEGESYVVSAWAKESGAAQDAITYAKPRVRVSVEDLLDVSFTGSENRPVIDGWQLIEGSFTMPEGNNELNVELICDDGECLFDDVRFFPADASMKCFVYDPQNLRFVAELDERHYATFYEYDNEGKLMRVKKETERGRMTLQETQHNTHHAQ